MAMQTSNQGGLSSEINVTPMIDVLLVLLIIFMIILPLSRRAFVTQVPPEKKQQQQPDTKDQIVLELTAEGGYAINRQPYAKAQLDNAFHQIYDQRVAKLLFIKTAPNRRYGDVIDAIDIAKGAGVMVIGFTPPPEPGQAPSQ
jgi:biopolymer transport protein ExbD